MNKNTYVTKLPHSLNLEYLHVGWSFKWVSIENLDMELTHLTIWVIWLNASPIHCLILSLLARLLELLSFFHKVLCLSYMGSSSFYSVYYYSMPFIFYFIPSKLLFSWHLNFFMQVQMLEIDYGLHFLENALPIEFL